MNGFGKINAALLFTVLGATLARADCAAEVSAVLANQPNFGSYHFRSVSKTVPEVTMFQGKVTMAGEAEMILPEGTVILIKDKGWVKFGDEWQALSAEDLPIFVNLLSYITSRDPPKTSNEKCFGKRAFRGMTYEAYYYESEKQLSNILRKLKVTIYLNPNGSVAWVDGESDINGEKNAGVQQYTYDAGITIKAPK